MRNSFTLHGLPLLMESQENYYVIGMLTEHGVDLSPTSLKLKKTKYPYITLFIYHTLHISHSSYITLFIYHTLHISHSSYITLFIYHTLHISHSSYITLFIYHTLHISHSSYITLFIYHTLHISHSSYITLFIYHTLHISHFNITLFIYHTLRVLMEEMEEQKFHSLLESFLSSIQSDKAFKKIQIILMQNMAEDMSNGPFAIENELESIQICMQSLSIGC